MKRFFRCDEQAATWFVVASGLEHAQSLLREMEVEDEVKWRELTAEEAAERRCHGDDGDIGALADANLGDVFCTEW